jgi:hypothetical protein
VLSKCCHVENDAFLPFVVHLEGKNRSKFRGLRKDVGGAQVIFLFSLHLTTPFLAHLLIVFNDFLVLFSPSSLAFLLYTSCVSRLLFALLMIF